MPIDDEDDGGESIPNHPSQIDGDIEDENSAYTEPVLTLAGMKRQIYRST